MKRFLLFAAAATMFFAACQKTVVVYDNPDPQEISFLAVNKTATKAPVDGTNFPTGDKMQVAAYLASGGTAAGNYFGKTEFDENGGVWTGGKYWPITASTINFLAVSEPDSDSLAVTTFNATYAAQSASVELTGNATAQYDLMYAAGQGKCSPGVYPKVDMQFRHALTWLFFTVKANVAATVTVNSIAVKSTAVDGTLAIDNSTNYAATTDVTSSAATIGATWTPDAKADQTVVGIPVDCTVALQEYNFGSLLVLPTASEAKSFTINYTITNGSDETTYNYTHNFTSEWNMSSKYTYNITIGLNVIEIDPDVIAWTTETASNVSLI